MKQSLQLQVQIWVKQVAAKLSKVSISVPYDGLRPGSSTDLYGLSSL